MYSFMIDNPNPEILWTMLEAVGTIAAAVVALFGLLYFEAIRPWIRQPKLSIVFEDGLPFKSTREIEIARNETRTLTSWAYLIRVGVKNTSKTNARGVRIKFSNQGNSDRYTEHGFISYDLEWVDTNEIRREALGKNELAYADFLISVKDDPEFWWFQPYNFSMKSGYGHAAGLPKTNNPPDIAYLEFTAYAENSSKVARSVYKVEYDIPKNNFRFFKISPSEDEIMEYPEIDDIPWQSEMGKEDE